METTNTTYNEDQCIICKNGFDDPTSRSKIFKKGLDSIIGACDIRNDIQLRNYLQEKYTTVTSGDLQLFIHKDCRRNFIKKRELEAIIENENVPESPKKLRSTTHEFDWKTDCIFCGHKATIDIKNPNANKVCSAMTLPYRGNLLEKCNNVLDKFCTELKHKLVNCYDLVHVEAVYHDECRLNFEYKYGNPDNPVTLLSPGRPKCGPKEQNFNNLCDWLEENAELYTLAELHTKMVENSNPEDVYSSKHLKKKLIDRYKEHIFFSEISGRPNVVCFKDMANYILTDKWHSDFKSSNQDDTEKLIIAAAKVITADIRQMDYSKDMYPTEDDISKIETGKQWLPRSLNVQSV